MTPPRDPFRYLDLESLDASTAETANGAFVHLGHGLRSKPKLLAEYVRQLTLPDYFGWNWDALEECLKDLSWLPAGQTITIRHAGLPLRHRGRQRAIYVAILRDAVARWSAALPERLVVEFPRQAQSQIEALLESG